MMQKHSWQVRVYDILKDREWHKLGDMFQLVELDIPLHFAQRHARGQRRLQEGDPLPFNTMARWMKFRSIVGTTGVDIAEPEDRNDFKWNTHVRLKLLDRACPKCGGDMIPAGWKARKMGRCLSCPHHDRWSSGHKLGMRKRNGVWVHTNEGRTRTGKYHKAKTDPTRDYVYPER